MPLPVLDVRPLQEAHALRGIGSYVVTLLGALPFTDTLVWAHLPQPPAAAATAAHAVASAPASGRFGWVSDAARSRRHRACSPVHLPLLDVRLATRRADVVTVLDAIPWRFPELYPAGRVGAVRRHLDAALARRADVVVTISQASADDIVRLLGVPSERIHVVPLFAGTAWPRPAAGAGRAGPEVLRNGRRYVVAAGGFRDRDPRKRLRDLLHTLPRLPHDTALVVTGAHGPYAAPFRVAAAELGVIDRLEMTGQLDLPDLVALFSGAAAFCFPSAWEGFGLPLLEAMSVGLPSVVADGGALCEVAGAGATVVPVGDVPALADALAELLLDARAAADASRRAAARAADFTQEAFAEGHLAAYR